MFDKINNLFQSSKNTLNLMAYRQKMISSNIANADTPNYHPLNINFMDTMHRIINHKKNQKKKLSLLKTSIKHLSLNNTNKSRFNLLSKNSIQSYCNKNTVDINQERTAFIDNSLKYQSQISFLKDEIKNIINTIQGQ